MYTENSPRSTILICRTFSIKWPLSILLQENFPTTWKIQSTNCLSTEQLGIFQSSFETFIKVSESEEAFWHLYFYNLKHAWHSCPNCDYSLRDIICEFLGKIWSWYLHWGYSLMTKSMIYDFMVYDFILLMSFFKKSVFGYLGTCFFAYSLFTKFVKSKL